MILPMTASEYIAQVHYCYVGNLKYIAEIGPWEEYPLRSIWSHLGEIEYQTLRHGGTERVWGSEQYMVRYV